MFWPLCSGIGAHRSPDLMLSLLGTESLSAAHVWVDVASEMGPAILGGSIWMIAIAIYSSGTVYLGILGVSVGWALFNITLILSGNLAGLLTGEWKAIARRIFNVNVAGVAVLLVATVIMAAANYSAY